MGTARNVSARWLAFCLMLTLLSANEARADKILIFQTKNSDPQGGDHAGADALVAFQALQHDVTLIADFNPVLPADLTPFDSIWVIQVPPLTSQLQNALIAYANEGGGVYLTGERSCCETLNHSVQNVAANLLRLPVPTVGGAPVEGGDLFTPTAKNPFSITSTPHALTQWKTKAAGLLMANVNPERAVFQNASGKIGAAVYPPEDFQRGAGCLYVAMDLTFWQSDVSTVQELTPYIENIERFLKSCGDSDHDGLSDQAELRFGTDPASPDTDKDGLCDGYATVAGVCISGEHPLDDVDENGIIGPLDPDDDNDGIPTSIEVGLEQRAPNLDKDLIPTWHDHDSDNDGFDDAIEGTGDYDHDGVPAMIDGDDYPQACSEEKDCGGATSGSVCNLAIGFCKEGCRGTGGNSCAPGVSCSSTDATIGTCSGQGGEGGGAGGGGNSAGTNGGGDSGGGAAGGGDGTNVRVPGCGCSNVGSAGALVAWVVLLGAKWSRRPRRQSQARGAR